MRVEQLAACIGVSVDTVRYYQGKGLLDPPRRQGRVAWYGEAHRSRLERIRTLQRRGFTLATIARLLSGELDAADEALLAELSGAREVPTAPPGTETDGAGETPRDGADRVLTLAELADATGVPPAVLAAVEAEGLLVPRRIGELERYTDDDVAAARAGLRLLEWGIPLSALLDLARRHHRATEEVAAEAVRLFSAYVREPLRRGGTPKVETAPGPSPSAPGEVEILVEAYNQLLAAVSTLVAHHFTRTLVRTALDHVDRVGSAAERQAVHDRIGADDEGAAAARAGADPALRR